MMKVQGHEKRGKELDILSIASLISHLSPLHHGSQEPETPKGDAPTTSLIGASSVHGEHS